MAVVQEARIKVADKRDVIIGVLVGAVLILGFLGWNQKQELDQLDARLSAPECYTAFGNVYQQCLADWLPWYEVTDGGIGE
jgi:hypothetical protein